MSKECEEGNPVSVAFVSVHCMRCEVFPTPQLCFRRGMACPDISALKMCCSREGYALKMTDLWPLLTFIMHNIWKTLGLPGS